MFWRTMVVLMALCSPAIAGPVDDARLDYINGDYAKALAVLEPAANKGNATAQNILGDAYDAGNGKPIDYLLALKWWQKAAKQKFAKAEYNLGLMLSQGRKGVPGDFPTAEKYLRRAMAQNNADAHNQLGLIYTKGWGRPVDTKQAFKLYKKGSDLGSIVATSNLGAAYAAGEGITTDYSKAFPLISKAANQGVAQALHNLAVLYENGYFVKKNLAASITLYKQAMQHGYVQAANNLADLMLQPGHFWSDPINGLAHCLWSKNNAENEKAYAGFSTNCDEVASKLSETQRQAAQILLKEL